MKIWMVCESLVEISVPNVTVLEIGRNLSKLGHEVLLFCPATDKEHAGLVDHDVYFVPSVRNRWLRGPVYQFFLMICMLWSCRGARPSWIYTRPVLAMLAPGLVARLLRKPHILHLSGDPLDQMRRAAAPPLLKRLYLLVERTNCMLSHRVVVETQRLKQIYEGRHNLPPERVLAIPNGVNIDLFTPGDTQEARRKVGIVRQGVLYVGYVGNLVEGEGVEYLVEAAPIILQSVPEARFLVVGDGPFSSELRRLAQGSATRDSFDFIGRVPYESVPLYMAAMDVAVVARSRSEFERTGISALKLREYLACGIPVVGTDIDGVGDVLREADAGIPVSPEDTSQFAEAITSLLQGGPTMAKMGRNGRRFVEEHLSWETTTRHLVEAYESAAAKG